MLNCEAMMHLVTMLVFLQSCAAFTVVQNRAVSATVLYAEYVPLEGEGKLNLKIDLDSPKVATFEELESGKKVYCRCWLSGTFPLCDGTHQKHNDKVGDNVGPLIVTVKK